MTLIQLELEKLKKVNQEILDLERELNLNEQEFFNLREEIFHNLKDYSRQEFDIGQFVYLKSEKLQFRADDNKNLLKDFIFEIYNLEQDKHYFVNNVIKNVPDFDGFIYYIRIPSFYYQTFSCQEAECDNQQYCDSSHYLFPEVTKIERCIENYFYFQNYELQAANSSLEELKIRAFSQFEQKLKEKQKEIDDLRAEIESERL